MWSDVHWLLTVCRTAWWMQGEEGGCGAGAALQRPGHCELWRCAGGSPLVRRAGAVAESEGSGQRWAGWGGNARTALEPRQGASSG